MVISVAVAAVEAAKAVKLSATARRAGATQPETGSSCCSSLLNSFSRYAATAEQSVLSLGISELISLIMKEYCR